MTKLSHRERTLAAINHKETDRVCIDLGSTYCSSLHREMYMKLREYLGLEYHEPRIIDRLQQVVEPGEDLMELFDVDLKGIFFGAGKADIEIENGYIDEWGVTRKKPPGSMYYDLTESPLSGSITMKDIENFSWPDPHLSSRVKDMRDAAIWLKENTEYALVFNYAASFIHQSTFIRGFRNWFEDFIINQSIICEIMDRAVDFYIELGKHAFKEIGDLVDIVYISDDICTQDTLMVSPKIYREFIKPRQKRVFDFIHSSTDAKLVYHNCGNTYIILNDLIEIGLDGLNPIQVSAKEMDPARLKKEFGDKIFFWGGIDTHKVLPFGTQEDVKKEVNRICNILAPGGGYILNPVHNIQPHVPPENIVAMIEAAKEWKFS